MSRQLKLNVSSQLKLEDQLGLQVARKKEICSLVMNLGLSCAGLCFAGVLPASGVLLLVALVVSAFVALVLRKYWCKAKQDGCESKSFNIYHDKNQSDYSNSISTQI